MMRVDSHATNSIPNIKHGVHDIIPEFKRKRNMLFSFITMVQNIKLESKILRFISIFFLILQNMFVSTFPHLSIYGIRNNTPYKVLITNILFFSTTTEELEIVQISVAVMISLLVISFFILIVIIIMYFQSRTTVFHFAYLLNFFLHIINPILIIPLGFQTGILIERCYLEPSTTLIVLSIASHTALLIGIVFLYCTYVFDAYSLFFPDSYFFTYTGKFIPVITVSSSLVLLFSHIFEMFYQKMPLVAVGVFLVVSIFCFIWTFWYPFGRCNTNEIISAVLFGMIISTIFSFTSLHDSEFDWVQYAALVGTSFFSFFILKISFQRRRAYILSSNPNNVSKSLFVLRIALMYCHPIFTSGELIENIARNVKNDIDRINLSRMICYFPDHQPLFVAQLAVLKKASSMPFIYEFLYFQLRRIGYGFQSNVPSEEHKYVKDETIMISSRLRYIWGQVQQKDIPYLFQSFDWLSDLISSCQRKWEALTTMYPYNSTIADEYSRFLIACKGDFLGASEWQSKSIQIQEGKIFQYSLYTVYFLKAFPGYAKKILPKKRITYIDDIDAKTKNEALATIIDNPEIRLELQRTVNATSNTTILSFLISSIISFIFLTSIWIIIIHLSFSEYATFINNMRVLYEISMLTQQVSMTLITVMLSMAEVLNLIPTADEIMNIVKQDRVNCTDSLVNFSLSFKQSIAIESEKGMKYFSSLHNSILNEIKQGKYGQTVLDQFFNNTISVSYYLTKNETVIAITNLQSCIISFFTSLTTISWRNDDEWVNENDMYNAASAGAQILDLIDTVSNAFLQNDYERYNQISFVFTICMIALYSFYIILYFIVPFIIYTLIKRQFSKIISSLKLFSQDIIEKALETSIIQHSNIETDTIIKVKSKSKLFIFIGFLLNLLMLILISIFCINSTQSHNDFIVHSSLVQLASTRACGSTKVLSSLLSSRLFYLIVPQVREKYNTRMQQAIRDFRILHELCGTISYENVGSFRDEILQLRTERKCPPWNEKTIHETLACMATDSLVIWYIDQAISLHSKADEEDLLRSDEFLLFMHFELSHLFYDLQKISEFLILSADNKSNHFQNFVIAIGIVSIVISTLQFIINISIYWRFKQINKLVIGFISQLSPVDITSNTDLLKVILNIYQNKSRHLSDSAWIVQHYSLPVIFIDRMSTIEAVNNAFTSAFGYDSNFIVCQPISLIIHDENTLSLIEMMKYMNNSEVINKEIQCRKEDGTYSNFLITVIPITEDYIYTLKYQNATDIREINTIKGFRTTNYNEETIIKRFTLIFKDQDKLNSLVEKCKTLKEENNSIISVMYPNNIRKSFYSHLKTVAICMIKLQNIGTESIASRVILQRQEIYNEFREILQIYSLLSLLSQKNGVFSVVASGLNDPTELAIECLNFAFTVVEYFMNTISFGSFSAVVETDDSLNVNFTGDETSKVVINGPIIERTQKLIENCPVGKVCISKRTYKYVMYHDMNFIKKTLGKESFYIVELNHITDDSKIEQCNSTSHIPSSTIIHNGIPITLSQQKIQLKLS